MAFLEVHFADGSTETRPLSRTQPVSVGRHATSDIRVDSPDVAPLHCRISWNKTAFEITAATPRGVEVNGQFVHAIDLNDGDLVRIGRVDVFLRAGEESDDSASHRDKRREAGTPVPLARVKYNEPSEPEPSSESVAELAAPSAPEPPLRKLATKLRTPPARPGEEEIARSPLVLGLGAAGLALLLAAAVFWFLLSRETAERMYDRAVAEMNDGKYVQAIQSFEQFLTQHPRNKLAPQARIGVGKTRIESTLSGSTPNWEEALNQLREFIQQHRDDSDFTELQGVIRRYSERIALGAAATAENTANRDLLALSDEARQLMVRHSPLDEPPVEAEKRIQAAYNKALDAIRKHEAYLETVSGIESAIQQKQPIRALALRHTFLTRYRDLANRPELMAGLQNALTAARQSVTRNELNRAAETAERPRPLPPPLSLVFHSRVRTEENSVGRVVLAVAKDCLYGVDTVTGDPLWRRVIGTDSPFFPLRVTAAQPGVLYFDTNFRELVLCDEETGQLVWRQQLDEAAPGAPLVEQGQIYLPTQEQHLCRLELESGRLTTRLSFIQQVVAPPVLLPDGEHLLLPGDEALIYTLSLRPLECAAVTYTGHQPGSVVAPVLPMGSLVLVAENDRLNQSLLRVFEARQPQEPLPQVASARIDGHVRETPVLRGRQLFVPSSGERVAAFTVADEPGQPPISLVAAYQVQNSYGGPLYLAAGPDNQFWMSGSAFRRLQVGTDSIRLDPQFMAVGLSAQPLQWVGSQFFLGRRQPFSGAVVFTQADRDRMAGSWKTVLGATPRMLLAGAAGRAVTVNESGIVASFTESRLRQGGIEARLGTELELPNGLTTPLRVAAVGDGRLVAHCGSPEPMLWIINSEGQIESRLKLDAPLQTDPIRLGNGLVLPLPGRLRFARLSANESPVEDLLAPIEKGVEHQWKQLAALESDEFLALDNRRQLLRVQLRTGDVPHLAEVARVELPQPVDVPFAVAKDRIVLADADGVLRVIHARTFEPLAELPLNALATQPVWQVGPTFHVETGRDTLHAVALRDGAKLLWSVPVEGPLAGAPLLRENSLLLALKRGEVWSLDPQTGQVRQRIPVGQPLSLGLRQLGETVIAPTEDGSFYSLKAVLDAEPRQ